MVKAVVESDMLDSVVMASPAGRVLHRGLCNMENILPKGL